MKPQLYIQICMHMKYGHLCKDVHTPEAEKLLVFNCMVKWPCLCKRNYESCRSSRGKENFFSDL